MLLRGTGAGSVRCSGMSDETLDPAEPSDAPRPVLIVVAVLALIALAAELFVGVTSAFAPAISPQVATAPATPAEQVPPQQTAAPATPAPNLPVQVPPAGG